MNLDRLVPVLVVLPREQDEVVRSATLEFSVRNRLEMLSVILTNARIVLSNNNIP